MASKMSIGEYVLTRFSSLAPPRPIRPKNPIVALRMLNRHQWNCFALAFCCWSSDAIDFFCTSLSATEIAETLDRPLKDITWGITLVLMLRSVGAVFFGLLSDRFGRRWPMIFNLFLFVVLEIGLGFVQTFKQFLAVRALFGIAMGGIYGMCAATALEDSPLEARGVLSGLMQQGYAFGYLIATIFYRALVPTTSHHWRSLMWFSAGPPAVLMVWRYFQDETETFKALKAARIANSDLSESKAHQFLREARLALRQNALIFGYLVLLMTGFNFASHGSQDLYPTFLKSQLKYSANGTTVTMVIANLGAISGGVTVGWISDFLGRRLTIILGCIIGGALLPAYTLIRNSGINAGAFFEQFMVQGIWGVIPAHLMELAPPAYRTFVVGTSYQLGNLASSASSTIEATLGAKYKTPKGLANYGLVIAIFMGCVYAYIILITFVGPENRNVRLAQQGEEGPIERLEKIDSSETFDGKHHNEHRIEHV